jgi:hypothetical protein
MPIIQTKRHVKARNMHMLFDGGTGRKHFDAKISEAF